MSLVNETLGSETEMRPRRLVSRLRQDRDLVQTSQKMSKTETFQKKVSRPSRDRDVETETTSLVLRTTTLSYGNMRCSGTCPAETPQPIKMKFCTIDYVDEVTRCAENGCNRWAVSSPTDRWNITSKTILTIPYLTLPYLTLPYLTFFFFSSPTAKTA
jgi:hypothetical protein